MIVNRKSIIFFVIPLLVLGGFFYLRHIHRKSIYPQYLPIEAHLCSMSGKCVYLEVASSKEEQKLGLMQRPRLPPNRGMLFRFQPPKVVHFWMFQTLLPLDIIFLSNEIVIGIESNSKPCHQLPCPIIESVKSVDNVLELASGEAEKLGIQIGDRLKINYH